MESEIKKMFDKIYISKRKPLETSKNKNIREKYEVSLKETLLRDSVTRLNPVVG